MALFAPPPMYADPTMAADKQHAFNPYSENGGSILAIAGADFTVIAGDTRQSEGYSIQTRYARKVWQLTDRCVIATNGFAADGNNFVKRIKQRLEWYEHAHQKQMSIKAIARLTQTMLYGNRFFPYFAYVILGGIDEDGTGAVYSFDPIGSYEREACRAAGAAQSLIQPFLDNQIYFRNQTPAPGAEPFVPGRLPLSTVLGLVIDSFTSATEREIAVGDGLELYVVMKKGRTTDDLVGSDNLIKNMQVQELGALGEGGSERTFLVSLPLKRD
ncbi:nucleophile aminohydrolase [Kockovaella imperatae]|uniref:Proteasome subunit beta n=1 Tax=Kockovaella imperatae TaxID=4999 RepID=A0A1Y1UMJ2_9TREE|nr:nucleophile aminohydrolase [Kockovaella imperatae]ORX39270.1 nucleophile aminohydrolase [Kockovaella imperatae]